MAFVFENQFLDGHAPFTRFIDNLFGLIDRDAGVVGVAHPFHPSLALSVYQGFG